MPLAGVAHLQHILQTHESMWWPRLPFDLPAGWALDYSRSRTLSFVALPDVHAEIAAAGRLHASPFPSIGIYQILSNSIS